MELTMVEHGFSMNLEDLPEEKKWWYYYCILYRDKKQNDKLRDKTPTDQSARSTIEFPDDFVSQINKKIESGELEEGS